ncbi:hypothetical protein [Paenibacillus sacheonensis]|uniref:EF-hand domain-containing protein n=1 Tax=Paenibacillus sacheonensis TaxID=742054 RepID=A0A7X5C2X8_9BACL|nr:hypothetical protein [Paenibacillus sacheonensis]MBM7569244.1 hypothetical protein [Paenibacillus sacheonensis]NBC71745.1 hypothetical protein [Paenibacillus sacheonensis]
MKIGKLGKLAAVCALMAGLLGAWPLGVSAHFEPIGYSDIAVNGSTVDYDLYMDPYQLLEFMDLDLNSDGYVDESEVSRQTETLEAFMSSGVQVSSGGEAVKPLIGKIEMKDRGLLPMIVAHMSFRFPAPVEDLGIDYAFFQKEGFVHHINMAHIAFQGETKDISFTKSGTAFRWDRTGKGRSVRHVSALSTGTIIRFGILAVSSLLAALTAALWKRRKSARNAA